MCALEACESLQESLKSLVGAKLDCKKKNVLTGALSYSFTRATELNMVLRTVFKIIPVQQEAIPT